MIGKYGIFRTLTTKNSAYDTLSLAFLVYRANDNRKRCGLLCEVTQTNLRNIENFKTKATGKKQMMFCIACAKSNLRQSDFCQ